jgi:hypothetical protein
MSALEIHLEVCVACAQNVFNEETVTQWCRMFKDGQTNASDEEQSGRIAICN